MQHYMKVSYLADCASDKSCVTFHDQLELRKKRTRRFCKAAHSGNDFKTQSKMVSEGEKNIKYFLNLENRHCKLNTRSQLQKN